MEIVCEVFKARTNFPHHRRVAQDSKRLSQGLFEQSLLFIQKALGEFAGEQRRIKAMQDELSLLPLALLTTANLLLSSFL